MANVFDKTSFIPQKSLNPIVKKKSSTSLFTIIAILIFVISAASSIGVFAYKKILEKSINQKAVSLERAKEAFDPGLIEELTALNNRIEASKDILASHILLTPLFALIEESTLKSVKFNQFDFTVQDSGQMELQMDGQATDYATVVLQSDLFGKNRFLSDQIFADINLDNSGNISFSYKAMVNPSLLLFKSNVEGF